MFQNISFEQGVWATVAIFICSGAAYAFSLYVRFNDLKAQNDELKEKIRDSQIKTKIEALSDADLDTILQHDIGTSLSKKD